MNTIKKSQFKDAVKQIIRECLSERSVNEIADSKINPLDDITRLVMKRGIKDPQKLDYLITNLYKHQIGSDPDPEAVAVAIERNKGIDESKWIQKAVDPKHKGYCTPMTKSTCTPARKALAMRFKKGDIHKDNVDETAYKTQGTSAKTFEDSPQLPDAQNNPENA